MHEQNSDEQYVNSELMWDYCSYTVYHYLYTVHELKNIKNESHGTIHTFKNYFATVFLVFSFSNNKLNPNGSYVSVWIVLILAFSIPCFAFFFWVPAALFDQVNHEQCIYALFMDPKTSLFSNLFIKNEFYDTIHTFKNYFVTVFLVSTKISSIQTTIYKIFSSPLCHWFL